MKLEDQVTSLETSKKLKELGVQQSSIAGWSYWPESGFEKEYPAHWSVSTGQWKSNNSFAAFNASELGAMLPETRGTKFDLMEYKYTTSFGLQIEEHIGEQTKVILNINEPFEAEARGKMLIYLLENNLLEKKDTK